MNNSVPTTPIVITDTAFGIPWRGAMVYVSDREGKITKINLTDSTKNGHYLTNYTFKLNATGLNGRVSFWHGCWSGSIYQRLLAFWGTETLINWEQEDNLWIIFYMA